MANRRNNVSIRRYRTRTRSKRSRAPSTPSPELYKPPHVKVLDRVLRMILSKEEFENINTRGALHAGFIEMLCDEFGAHNPSPAYLDLLVEYLPSYFDFHRERNTIHVYDTNGNKVDEHYIISSPAAQAPDNLDRYPGSDFVTFDSAPPTPVSSYSDGHYAVTVREDDGQLLMSGALPPNSKIPVVDDTFLSRTVCDDNLRAQLSHQSFRIIPMKELRTYDLFEDEDMIEHLGSDFLITPMGLYRAWTIAAKDHGSSDSDVLINLWIRGGRLSQEAKRRSVVYPEDMEPIVSSYDPSCDIEYWNMLYQEGAIWDELP